MEAHTAAHAHSRPPHLPLNHHECCASRHRRDRRRARGSGEQREVAECVTLVQGGDDNLGPVLVRVLECGDKILKLHAPKLVR